jgi:hypothetical protein
MSKKTVIILWAIVMVLGTGVIAIKSRKRDNGEANTERHRGQTVLASFPAADVTTVKIKGAEQSVTLNKTADGWVVAERGNYPANFGNINNLLRTIESVKINHAIEAGPTYGKRFGMDLTAKKQEDHGVELTFLKADQSNAATIFLGKDSTGGGRYIQNAADTTGIYVTSESFPTASPNPKDWLNEAFIAVDKITSVAMTSAGKPDQLEWKLTRSDENAEFALEGAKPEEKLDTNATSMLKTILASARFQDVATTEPKAVEESAERRVATLTTADGFTYTLHLLAKPALQVPDALAQPGETPPPAEENFQMTVKVEGKFATERTKPADEKPEDAKAADEAFQASLKALQEKLKTEQSYQGRVFEVSKYTIDALLKSRAELLQAPATDAAATPASPTGNPALEATTPPISIDGP